MRGPPWRLELSAPAKRDLLGLPEKAATAVVESLDAIAASPHRIGKPLRFELEGLRVTRRGPYRIIYVIDEDNRVVAVVAIGHRSDVYRSRRSRPK